MSFYITCSKLTGSPSKGSWAQIHEFKPDDEEKLKLRGHLFAVISTRRISEDGQVQDVESVAFGRELLARFHEEYFGNTTLSAFNALGEACEKVINEFRSQLGNVQIAAVAILDDVVYSAAGGGAKVAIFRQGMIATILDSQKDGGEKVKAITASGYPNENDLLVVGTNTFFNNISSGSVKAALENKNPESAIELLAPAVHSVKEAGDLGVAILKFEKDRAPAKEEVERDVSKPPQQVVKEEIEKKHSGKRPLFAKAKDRLIKRISSRIDKLPERRIYVKKGEVDVEEVQNRRLAISVGVVLLILLVISIAFGIRQKKAKDEKAIYEPTLNEAKHQFEESISLFSLDEKRSRELFLDSKQKVEQLINEGVEDEELNRLSEDINNNLENILGEYSVEPDLFIDLTLLSDNFGSTDLSKDENSLFVFDKDSKKAIKIDIQTKRSEVVAGPGEIKEGKDIAVYSDRVFVLNESAIIEIGEKEEVAEATWGNESMIYAYAGNLYVLDKNASKIWRFAGFEGGFSEGKNWFAEGVEPDLSKIISWTIDGSMWLLSSTGNVFKFSLGNQLAFDIEGAISNLASSNSIYTNEEQSFLYMLDPKGERILVLEKEGRYKAQYKAEIIKDAKEIIVSEKEKKAILLINDKLYSIDLKHLE